LRGFTEGCEDKPRPCWYGVVPGVTNFDDVPKILMRTSVWKPETIKSEIDPITQKAVWRITNVSFTDCRIIIGTGYSQTEKINEIDFYDCSHIVLGHLVDFIEYPGTIYPDCFPSDRLEYRSITIFTDDDLLYAKEYGVKSFTLYQRASDDGWKTTLNDLLQYGKLNGYSTKRWQYWKIAIAQGGCG
jgi:hypothetical protein